MNYLQLAQRLREKVGGAGEGPPTITGQRGEYSRYVNWINEAWGEIQSFREDWAWMHKTVSNPLVVGVNSYNDSTLGIADFGAWDLRGVRLFEASIADERFLKFIDFDLFKQRYGFGSPSMGRPSYVSRDTANNIVLHPTPDKAYTLTTDYFNGAINLISNTDIPAMPDRFHLAIVYKAMEYAGRFENASEIVVDGATQYNQILQRIESSQMPEVTAGVPLL